MNATSNVILDDLQRFARSLTKEQADFLIVHLPTVIAILEEQGERFLQIQFQRNG